MVYAKKSPYIHKPPTTKNPAKYKMLQMLQQQNAKCRNCKNVANAAAASTTTAKCTCCVSLFTKISQSLPALELPKIVVLAPIQ